MKSIIEVFFSVLQKLESEQIPYMVVGSIASMVYGEPRMTHDMDVVIDIMPGDVAKFESLFPSAVFYCPPLEVLKSEAVSRGQFNLMHFESGLKIDIVIRKATDHAISEFKRRRKVPFWQGSEVYLASPEDVILKKLDFYRQGGSDKHLRDIRGVLAETNIDMKYLNQWVSKLNLTKEWSQV